MTNDTNNENLNDSLENIENEGEIVIEEENNNEEEKKQEKPAETPEQKYARISRMKEQLEKKHGFGKKEEEKEDKPKSDFNLTTSDTIALINAKVNEDDIAEVIDYAKLKNISVKDALKSNIIKTMLRENEEMRNSAQATNTSNARRSAAKVSDEELVNKARKGELPESIEDIQKIIKAKLKIK